VSEVFQAAVNPSGKQMQETIVYKLFNNVGTEESPILVSGDSREYKVGKYYHIGNNRPPEICENGFHGCYNATNCLFYSTLHKTIFTKCIFYGDLDSHATLDGSNPDKVCARMMYIKEIVPNHQVFPVNGTIRLETPWSFYRESGCVNLYKYYYDANVFNGKFHIKDPEFPFNQNTIFRTSLNDDTSFRTSLKDAIIVGSIQGDYVGDFRLQADIDVMLDGGFYSIIDRNKTTGIYNIRKQKYAVRFNESLNPARLMPEWRTFVELNADAIAALQRSDVKIN
jgi:hypothetical protein